MKQKEIRIKKGNKVIYTDFHDNNVILMWIFIDGEITEKWTWEKGVLMDKTTITPFYTITEYFTFDQTPINIPCYL